MTPQETFRSSVSVKKRIEYNIKDNTQSLQMLRKAFSAHTQCYLGHYCRELFTVVLGVDDFPTPRDMVQLAKEMIKLQLFKVGTFQVQHTLQFIDAM